MDDHSRSGGDWMISTAATAGRATAAWKPAETLSIAVDQSQAAATVIVAEGELDSSSSPRLREALFTVIRAGASVVLDLNGLRFMGSAGLAVLLAATEQAREVDATLRLVVAPDNRVVGRPLTLTGLASALSISPDLAAALQQLA